MEVNPFNHVISFQNVDSKTTEHDISTYVLYNNLTW